MSTLAAEDAPVGAGTQSHSHFETPNAQALAYDERLRYTFVEALELSARSQGTPSTLSHPAPTVQTIAELAGYGDSRVVPGDQVYVAQTDAYFAYRNPGTNPPAGGASHVKAIFLPGFWEQLATGSGAAMAQFDWFIDPLNGSDANDGKTAATALKTDTERQNRMGSFPTWDGVYHLRYLNDVDLIVLLGIRTANATIFVHGSTADNVGQSVLYAGTIDALTALNRNASAGGQPILITSNGLPVSWASSGFVGARMRRTTDNATGWVMKDLGSKQCRSTEWTVAGTYSVPFVAPAAAATPAGNDPIVVERLTKIKGVVCDLVGRGPSNFSGVIFDSVDLGDHNLFQAYCPLVTVLAGCILRNTSSSEHSIANITLSSCRLAPAPGQVLVIPPRAMFITFNGGYCDGDGGGNSTAQFQPMAVGTFNRYMTQGVRLVLLTTPGGDAQGWSVRQLGVFDNPSGDAITLKSPQAFFLSGAAAVIWGSGNGGFGIGHRNGSSWLYTTTPLAVGTNLNIVGAAGDIAFGGRRSQCRAFDDSTGAYTGLRTLSFANVVATIANGGFCANAGVPQFTDPVSGCAIGMTS